MKIKMNTIRWVTGTLLLGSVLIFAAVGVASSATKGWLAGELGEFEGAEHREADGFVLRAGFKQDSVFSEECGACHLAYPPALLPVESWRKMMGNLNDHFGENAELDQPTAAHIGQYLEQQALQAGKRSKMSKMLRNLPDEPPMRITQLPYFVHEHDEIPRRMVKGNSKVGSFSQCDSCHEGAAEGFFDEDRVYIPGVGRWDD